MMSVAAEGRGEAASHSCANIPPPIHGRSKLARKPAGIVALAFLNPASPEARLEALSTNVDRAWQEKRRERQTRPRLADIRSDPSTPVSQVRGPD
jgi:hypothetical protein